MNGVEQRRLGAMDMVSMPSRAPDSMPGSINGANMRRLRGAARSCALLCCAAALAACAGSPGGGSDSAASGAAGRDYLALAMGYFESGDLAAARRHLDNARNSAAEQSRIDHVAALIAAADSDFELAEYHFHRALRLARDDAALSNNYGVLLYSLERDEEALARFRVAAADQAYRGRAHALENLGRVLLRRRRPEEALAAFSAALDLNGELPMAALESSLLHRRGGNLIKAERLYRDYLDIAERQLLPHGPKALLAGAEFAWQSGDRGEMEEFGTILGRLYPETAEYRAYLGLIDGNQ